jgi:hypothetical protein
MTDPHVQLVKALLRAFVDTDGEDDGRVCRSTKRG